ncbi:MAG TPA: TlpA disulfide reductase family protein [Bryobacteraceae bacterium]|nr:TlpA disulfide reductase family protein [Bryobacteraceae bacterium]
MSQRAVKPEPETGNSRKPASMKLERIIHTLIGLLLAVFVWVIFDSFHERLVVVGDSAPDFSITADNGRTITNSNFGGKLLVLNFWATWCPPCIEELPSLNAFQRQFANSGVVVLGVSIDKDENAYREFLAKARISFLTARDPEKKISSEYGTQKVPETYIIDGRGKVLRKIISNTDWMSDRMLADVRSLL